MAEDDLVTGLARQYPTWHIWRGRRADNSPGDPMATRRRDLSSAELDAGLARTLPMGYHGDLPTQLAEQAARESYLDGPLT